MKLEDMKASVDSMRVVCASVLGVTAYNENHDEKGRFSSGDGGGDGASKATDKANQIDTEAQS